jgi:RNA methyltransferase, TrmH family
VYDLHRRLLPVGPSHLRVRQFLDIRDNKKPHDSTMVTLEGLWMLRAARAGGCSIEAVFVCPGMLRGAEPAQLVDALLRDGALGLSVSARVLARMVGRDGPDGLAAVGRVRRFELRDLRAAEPARCLVVDGCELPGNLGSLVRCADAVGVCAVIVTGCRLRLNHPLVLKASMGTVFFVPVSVSSPEGALKWLRERGFHLLAADPSSSLSYRQAAFPPRVAIVLGSERQGLSPFWRAAADQRVSIPMLGRADSLNVGHAGAVLLYEALHRHTAEHGHSSGAPGR